MQLRDQFTRTQSGGFADPSSASGKSNSDQIINKIKEAEAAGCTPGPQFAMPLDRGQGALIQSQMTPSAPGETKIVEDPTYNKDFDLPLLDPTRLLPVNDANQRFQTPTFNTPHRDAQNNAANTCGNLASDYSNYLKNQTGANRPVYKEGCPGASGCAANEIGKFGLIEAAYNNDKQSVNVSSLLSKTPGNVTANDTVAFKDKSTGSANEVNGCRLSNYASCGLAGDIIMVQTNPAAGSTDGFDTFLIYNGNGSFYEVTGGGSQVIKSGSIDPSYNSMSYAAVRMNCASGPATAAATP